MFSSLSLDSVAIVLPILKWWSLNCYQSNLCSVRFCFFWPICSFWVLLTKYTVYDSNPKPVLLYIDCLTKWVDNTNEYNLTTEGRIRFYSRLWHHLWSKTCNVCYTISCNKLFPNQTQVYQILKPVTMVTKITQCKCINVN